MGKFYSLKDFVHEQGLNMGEFHRLDKETQQKWREIHQRKLKEKLAELNDFSESDNQSNLIGIYIRV